MPETHEHIVKSFDTELTRLYGEISRMGAFAVAQLDAAIDVLQRRDSKAAERVVANDEAIDALEHEVSTDVLRLLALRQPMARDLREVYAALRISADIERIGDYAANVAKRSMALNQVTPVPPARSLPALAKLANELVRESVQAYRERDADRHGRGSQADHRLHPSAVHGQEHRADRRSRHQHRREHLVPGARRADCGKPQERRSDQPVAQPGIGREDPPQWRVFAFRGLRIEAKRPLSHTRRAHEGDEGK
jgi:phosphate transport system regulatory protein PhoU